MKSFLQTCIIFGCFFTLVSASSGDRQRIFKQCVTKCTSSASGCQPNTLSPLLHILGWSCQDDCSYFCMHELTTQALESGGKVHQYFGKWPFWRWYGMQEPASVAFSLLNMWFHLDGALRIYFDVPTSHPMKHFYLGWAATSINCWIWSAVFHTRGSSWMVAFCLTCRLMALPDKPLTEKLDYFSAALTILYALYTTVIRLFHMYPPTPTSRWPFPLRLWTLFCATLFLGHISYLSLLPRFDYTYNIIFNVIVGLSHNVLWLAYSLPTSLSFFKRYPHSTSADRPRAANKAALLVLLTTAATFLEVFDFPPWKRVIDAHSLWHLSTAIIAPFWYQFLVEDSLERGWRR